MLQKKYNHSPDAVVTYSLIDILKATGQLQIFAIDFNDGTASFVSTIAYSDKGFSVGGATINFETEFNKTFDIQGKGIVNLPVGIIRTGAGVGGTGNADFVWTLFHYDTDNNETQLDTGTLNWAWTGSRAGDVNPDRASVLLDEVGFGSLTSIKAGEKLKLRVVVPADPLNEAIYIAHDPMNRKQFSGTALSTASLELTFEASKLELRVPVKLEV